MGIVQLKNRNTKHLSTNISPMFSMCKFPSFIPILVFQKRDSQRLENRSFVLGGSVRDRSKRSVEVSGPRWKLRSFCSSPLPILSPAALTLMVLIYSVVSTRWKVPTRETTRFVLTLGESFLPPPIVDGYYILVYKNKSFFLL